MALELPNLYFRWTGQPDGRIKADILLPGVFIGYDAGQGLVQASVGRGAEITDLDPDTARMIGVRLIEAASRAEADRKTRTA